MKRCKCLIYIVVRCNQVFTYRRSVPMFQRFSRTRGGGSEITRRKRSGQQVSKKGITPPPYIQKRGTLEQTLKIYLLLYILYIYIYI